MTTELGTDTREDRKSCEGLTTVMKASEVLPSGKTLAVFFQFTVSIGHIG